MFQRGNAAGERTQDDHEDKDRKDILELNAGKINDFIWTRALELEEVSVQTQPLKAVEVKYSLSLCSAVLCGLLAAVRRAQFVSDRSAMRLMFWVI